MPFVGSYILVHKPTGNFYVGSSSNVDRRISIHLNQLRKGIHHNFNFQRLWNANPTVTEFVFPTTDREEAYTLEQIIINNNLDNDKLLNIGISVKGGDNLTRNPNKDLIVSKITDKIRERNSSYSPLERKLIYGKYGEKNGMWGKTHTPEVKKLLSDNMKKRTPRSGFKLSEAQKSKLSECAKLRVGPKNPFYGKKHTEETKKKLRERFFDNPRVSKQNRKVKIGSKVYISVSEAARQLGVSPALIIYRLRNTAKYPNYSYAD